MNLGMHTALLNTYPPKLIATILKALREQLKEKDQLKAVDEIAGPVPEIILEYDQILKGGKFGERCQRWISARRSCVGARREEIDLRDCSNARVQRCGHGTIGPNLGGHIQVCGYPTRKKSRSRSCAREDKTKKQGEIQRALPPSQLFSAMPPLEAVLVHVSIMMSVSLSNRGKPLKLRHYDISTAHFQGTAQRLIYIKLPAEDRQKYGEDKVRRLIKSMYGTQDASHIWQL